MATGRKSHLLSQVVEQTELKRTVVSGVHKFAGAAGTEYHKRGRVKPQKHIVFQS